MQELRQRGASLETASAASKRNRKAVLAAVQQNGFALCHADETLKRDRDFILAAAKQNGHALTCADAALKRDRGVVLAAVQQNGYALAHADAALKRDHGVVLAAVQENGFALQHAGDALKDDEQVVLAAVKQNSAALKYASTGMQERGVIKKAAEAGLPSIGKHNKSNVWIVRMDGTHLEMGVPWDQSATQIMANAREVFRLHETSMKSMKLLLEGQTRALDPSETPYPRVLETVLDNAAARRLPNLTLVTSN